MPRRLPGSREEDSWLSESQLSGLARAELRRDYLAAGGHPSNRRYGWIQRS